MSKTVCYGRFEFNILNRRKIAHELNDGARQEHSCVCFNLSRFAEYIMSN